MGHKAAECWGQGVNEVNEAGEMHADEKGDVDGIWQVMAVDAPRSCVRGCCGDGWGMVQSRPPGLATLEAWMP